MDIKDVSDSGLKMLHQSMYDSVVQDDATPDGKKPYSVRSTPDFKLQSDAYEAELQERGLPFTPVPWETEIERAKRPGEDFSEAVMFSSKLRRVLRKLTLNQAETIFCDILAVMEEKRREENSN